MSIPNSSSLPKKAKTCLLSLSDAGTATVSISASSPANQQQIGSPISPASYLNYTDTYSCTPFMSSFPDTPLHSPAHQESRSVASPKQSTADQPRKQYPFTNFSTAKHISPSNPSANLDFYNYMNNGDYYNAMSRQNRYEYNNSNDNGGNSSSDNYNGNKEQEDGDEISFSIQTVELIKPVEKKPGCVSLMPLSPPNSMDYLELNQDADNSPPTNTKPTVKSAARSVSLSYGEQKGVLKKPSNSDLKASMALIDCDPLTPSIQIIEIPTTASKLNSQSNPITNDKDGARKLVSSVQLCIDSAFETNSALFSAASSPRLHMTHHYYANYEYGSYPQSDFDNEHNFDKVLEVGPLGTFSHSLQKTVRSAPHSSCEEKPRLSAVSTPNKLPLPRSRKSIDLNGLNSEKQRNNLPSRLYDQITSFSVSSPLSSPPVSASDLSFQVQTYSATQMVRTPCETKPTMECSDPSFSKARNGRSVPSPIRTNVKYATTSTPYGIPMVRTPSETQPTLACSVSGHEKSRVKGSVPNPVQTNIKYTTTDSTKAMRTIPGSKLPSPSIQRLRSIAMKIQGKSSNASLCQRRLKHSNKLSKSLKNIGGNSVNSNLNNSMDNQQIAVYSQLASSPSTMITSPFSALSLSSSSPPRSPGMDVPIKRQNSTTTPPGKKTHTQFGPNNHMAPMIQSNSKAQLAQIKSMTQVMSMDHQKLSNSTTHFPSPQISQASQKTQVVQVVQAIQAPHAAQNVQVVQSPQLSLLSPKPRKSPRTPLLLWRKNKLPVLYENDNLHLVSPKFKRPLSASCI